MLSSAMLKWNWNVEFIVVDYNVQFFFSINMLLCLELKWKMLKCLMSTIVVMVTVPQIYYKSSPHIVFFFIANYKFEAFKKIELGSKKIKFGSWKNLVNTQNIYFKICVFC